MLKKIRWQENAVFSIQLRDDVFSLMQMRKNGLMQFFAISKANNDWTGTDLGREKTLFTRFVAEKNLTSLIVDQLAREVVRPTGNAIETRMLSAVIGNNGQHGARLIELTPEFESLGGVILKEGLTPERDLDLIYAYELAGVAGDAEKIRKRLIRYFESGVNWDDAKSFIFKDIALPPASGTHHE